MFKRLLRNRFTPVWLIILSFIVISILTRLTLMLVTKNSFNDFNDVAGTFLIGLAFDLVIAVFAGIPFVLQIWLRNDFIYRKKIFPYVLFTFAILFALIFSNLVPKDFNSALYHALIIYVLARLVIYLSLYFLPPTYRKNWRNWLLWMSTALFILILLLNAVSEYFFWQEFSSRYNFIAVDYLVYTTEVLGNIKESYPVFLILFILISCSILVVVIFRKLIVRGVDDPLPFKKRSLFVAAYLGFSILFFSIVHESWRHFSKNEYANALAGNGIYEFAHAFTENELDFYSFYQTIPDKKAFRLLRNQLQTPNSRYVGQDDFSIEREISYDGTGRKLNVVMISVESLSADFMQHFGSSKIITPYLDSLADKSVLFTNLYASGTRTVRGLEALSLSLPPTPGQSIVKRPGNSHLFSLGSVLRKNGYTTQYLYGGYSYFDNMKDFFGGNGYTVIDRSAISNDAVHYQNIWGVADEDLFTMALHVLDSNSKMKKPFFSHIMTVSNHRPYSFPAGRIDIDPVSQTREGAVKYTDYAINKFLKEAAAMPWFDSTIFVIVADHCAGSAGNVALPVTGYHIPMLIFAPKILAAAKINTLTAQIDIAPTILGLLKIPYRSKFFGMDVLNMPPEKQRAFISTYQGLGFLKNGRLLIQSPVKKIAECIPDFKTGNAVSVKTTDSLMYDAIAAYQCASWLLTHKKQGE